MIEVEKKIKEQIDTYYNLSDKMHIDALLRLQDGISGNSFYLAQTLGDIYQNHLSNVFETRNKKVKTFLGKKAEKITDKSITDKLAEKMSEDESMKEYAKELFSEGERERYALLLKQVNAVLHAISQRISYLKDEKRQTIINNN